MRDPARIEIVLASLRAAWERHPDLRLGQLVVLGAEPKSPCPEIFHIEDQALVDAIGANLAKYSGSGA